MRISEVARKTNETSVTASLNIDGTGLSSIDTGIPFFNHMLDAFTRHGTFDLNLKADGDLSTGCHHTIEDTGIVLGQVIYQCLKDCMGIRRFSSISIPMDESKADISMDLGGRSYLVFDGSFSGLIERKIEPSLICHFFESLVQNARITIHISVNGYSDHHKCEAIFKAFGVALHDASRITRSDGQIPSTKGVLYK